jgi:hypothetical protein
MTLQDRGLIASLTARIIHLVSSADDTLFVLLQGRTRSNARTDRRDSSSAIKFGAGVLSSYYRRSFGVGAGGPWSIPSALTAAGSLGAAP